MAGTFLGAIFDVDGVLVDSPHERAWRESLRALMEGEWRDIRASTRWTPGAFTSEVYERFVSGKPRLSGARAALEHFGVPDVEARAQVYADRKQAMVSALIDAGEFAPYPDALRFVLAVKDAGIPIAAASSSKNAAALLQKIRVDCAGVGGEASRSRWSGRALREVFDVDVSGRDFAHGKPHPDMFLAAARALSAAPERCFVVEDAPAGVEAAKAGGMAALGVARREDACLLAQAGADLVVRTLDDVDLGELRRGRLAAKEGSAAA